MSLSEESDSTPCEVCGRPTLYGSRHPKCGESARAIERAATIAAHKRDAEICANHANETHMRFSGTSAMGAENCEKEIRAEIAKLEAEK